MFYCLNMLNHVVSSIYIPVDCIQSEVMRRKYENTYKTFSAIIIPSCCFLLIKKEKLHTFPYHNHTCNNCVLPPPLLHILFMPDTLFGYCGVLSKRVSLYSFIEFFYIPMFERFDLERHKQFFKHPDF